MWIAVAAILLGTCKVNLHEHQASDQDKETYIRLMEEADILRDVLVQSEETNTDNMPWFAYK